MKRSVIDTALAILEQRQLTPDLPWCAAAHTRSRWSEKLAKRSENPPDTLDLAPYFPDWDSRGSKFYDEDYRDADAEYNAMTPEERAISEVFSQIDTDGYTADLRNPIFLYELHQAELRTLARLVAMAARKQRMEVKQ
jgi:hypothetical protein